MKKFIYLFTIICTSVVLIAGCGGSSSSGSSDPLGDTGIPTTTTFTVAVDVPNAFQQVVMRDMSLPERMLNFVLPGAYAVDGSSLTADNFAVTIVDPDGKVVEVVEIAVENISQNADGTWEIIVPGDTRFDCLVVVDINEPITLTVGNPLPADTVYAPTTAAGIDIDVASTAAYQEFLASLPETITSFAGYDKLSVDEIEEIINLAQEVALPAISQGQTLEQYLATVSLLVQNVVKQSVELAINSTDTTGTVASMLQGGGVHWAGGSLDYNNNTFSYEFNGEYSIIQEGGETIYQWNGTTFVEGSLNNEDILLDSGWVSIPDEVRVDSINGDGSVDLSIVGAPSRQFKLSTNKVLGLAGVSIRSLFSGDDFDNFAWAAAIPVSATFSAGAEGFLEIWTAVTDNYWAWGDINSDPASCTFDCSFIGINNVGLATTLSSLVSAEAATDLGLATAVFIEFDSTTQTNLLVELVDDGTTKTANYISSSFDSQTFSPVYTSLASSTWRVVEHSSGVTFYQFKVPEDLADTYDSEDEIALFEHNGYVRGADYFTAGSVEDSGEWWLFNAQAMADIVAAIDTSLRLVHPLAGVSECFMGNSDWDDVNGRPLTPHSYAEYETAVDSCMTATGRAFVEADLSGKTFILDEDRATFNADGSGSFDYVEDGVDKTDIFSWSINGGGNLLVNNTETAGGQLFARDEWRLVQVQPGMLSIKAFYEDTNFADADLSTGAEGEIWSGILTDADLLTGIAPIPIQ